MVQGEEHEPGSFIPSVKTNPMSLGDLFLKSRRIILVCKRARRVIGLNGASGCFIWFLNVRASFFKGKGISTLFLKD